MLSRVENLCHGSEFLADMKDEGSPRLVVRHETYEDLFCNDV